MMLFRNVTPNDFIQTVPRFIYQKTTRTEIVVLIHVSDRLVGLSDAECYPTWSQFASTDYGLASNLWLQEEKKQTFKFLRIFVYLRSMCRSRSISCEAVCRHSRMWTLPAVVAGTASSDWSAGVAATGNERDNVTPPSWTKVLDC